MLQVKLILEAYTEVSFLTFQSKHIFVPIRLFVASNVDIN